MAVAPQKKAQTCINRFAEECADIRASNRVVKQIKQAVIAHGLVPYFPPGSVQPLSDLADQLDALCNNPVIDALFQYYVDTHRGAALPGEVDDAD